MTEPTFQEHTRIALVAPWSMLGIIIFGLVSSNYGLIAGAATSIFLMVGATFLFPKSGIAASPAYKVLFVSVMALCFVGIATLLPLVSGSYEFAVWLLLYFAAVGSIEVAGMLLEQREKGV